MFQFFILLLFLVLTSNTFFFDNYFDIVRSSNSFNFNLKANSMIKVTDQIRCSSQNNKKLENEPGYKSVVLNQNLSNSTLHKIEKIWLFIWTPFLVCFLSLSLLSFFFFLFYIVCSFYFISFLFLHVLVFVYFNLFSFFMISLHFLFLSVNFQFSLKRFYCFSTNQKTHLGLWWRSSLLCTSQSCSVLSLYKIRNPFASF